MEGSLPYILEAILLIAATAFVTYFVLDRRAKSSVRQAQLESDRIIEEAEARRRQAAIEAKDEALKLRNDLERELGQRRKEIDRIERRVEQKEEGIDRKTQSVDQREQNLKRQEQSLQKARTTWEEEQVRQQEALDRERNRHIEELERVAGLTAFEARDELVAEVEAEARAMAGKRVREIEQEIHEEADKRSRKILATAIQRIATDYIAESTVSVVPIPSDDMKGRIIGREGRNIRALEQATGVDLIVDDTPEVIMISSFDPLRRELARRVLSRLLQDGRIHPAKIEEVVNKTQSELDQVIREEGEKVAFEANVVGLHPDLIKLLGRLKYRTSYGQNVLAHSLETSIIAGALASELGADVNICKTAGLLHDIGKAVDHEVEGPHALIGADIARRLGRSSKIVHAIAAHHGEEEPLTVEAFIVATSDAISGATSRCPP